MSDADKEYIKQLESHIESLENKLEEFNKISERERRVMNMIYDYYKKDTHIVNSQDVWIPSLGKAVITLDAREVATILHIEKAKNLHDVKDLFPRKYKFNYTLGIIKGTIKSFWKWCITYEG